MCQTPAASRARESDYGGARRCDEAQLRHLCELSDVARELEERVEAGALARAEPVAQLLEVPCQEPGGVAVALRRLVRELLGLRARGAHRRHQRVFELREARVRRLGSGP